MDPGGWDRSYGWEVTGSNTDLCGLHATARTPNYSVNGYFSVLSMVINADLQQAALSGQDDTTAKYVQTFYFLDHVPIFHISAI